MVSELQSLVDNLGARLRRSVAIDDRNLRLLAYNSHHGDVDPLRLHSLIRREAPKELVDYLYSLGGFDAEDLFVQPVKPELGLTIERMVMPIRHAGSLLGFLWLLRSDGPLDADECAAVRIAAERAGRLLGRDHVIDQSRQASIRAHLRDLLGPDAGARDQAMERLVEEDMLVAGPVTVLVVTLPREAGQPLGERDRGALEIGAEQACRRVPPSGAVHLERSDHGVIVVAYSGARDQDIDDLAAAVRQRVRAETGGPAADCYVGIGERYPSLRDVGQSYAEARRAADVGRAIRLLGAVVRHSRLGVYSLLADIPLDGLRRSIHPGLRRLLDYDADHGDLAGTLEAFFDNATDVSRTAAQLNIHRASLHYRLRRIQEITGLDLSTGDDRLSLHLGLKVTRLIGLRLGRVSKSRCPAARRTGTLRRALADAPAGARPRCRRAHYRAVSTVVAVAGRRFCPLPVAAVGERGTYSHSTARSAGGGYEIRNFISTSMARRCLARKSMCALFGA
jgi:hypothetical protein